MSPDRRARWATLNQENTERPKNTERYQLKDIGGIVVSGAKGTGKTTILKLLNTGYGLPLVNVGSDVRKKFEEETGTHFGDARERDPSLDVQVDLAQCDLFRKATSKNPFACDSNLGPFFAKNMEKSGLLQAPIINILLYTDPPEIATHRSAKREAEKKGTTIDEELTTEERRRQKDWTQWRDLYKPLQGIDLHKPGATDRDRRPFYDLEINTAAQSKEETATLLHNWMVKKGYVVEGPQELPTSRRPRQIYPAA